MDEQATNKDDYLLEVLEMALNRDPDQDFELLLVMERARAEINED